jgi:O-antigen/teichoic acid export membrane protein
MLNRISKNLVAIFFGQAIALVGTLVMVPIYLSHWSTRLYGEWLALFSLVSYLSNLDLGMNIAATNRLTQAYSKGDLDEYSRYIHSATLFYTLIVIGGSLILALITMLLPVQTWLGLQEITQAEADWVIWLLGFQILLSIILGLLGKVYFTTGHLAVSQWLSNIYRLLLFVSITVGLILQLDIVMIALIQLIPGLIIGILIIWDLRRRYPALMPGFRLAKKSLILELLVPSLFFVLIMLANAINQQGPILVVSPVLGGAAVALLATTRTLTNVIRQAVGTISNAFWPDLTRLETSRQASQLQSLHRILVTITTMLCIAIAAVIWFEGEEILVVWTRGRLEPDILLLRLLLIYLVLQSPWLASSTFTAATNRHRKMASLQLTSMVIAIVVISGSVNTLNLWAVPLGLIIGEAIACYHWIIQDTCRVIGENYLKFVTRIWPGLLILSGWAWAAAFFAHRYIQGPLFFRLMAAGGVVLLAVSLPAWFIWLTSADKKIILSRVQPTVSAFFKRLLPAP